MIYLTGIVTHGYTTVLVKADKIAEVCAQDIVLKP